MTMSKTLIIEIGNVKKFNQLFWQLTVLNQSVFILSKTFFFYTFLMLFCYFFLGEKFVLSACACMTEQIFCMIHAHSLTKICLTSFTLISLDSLDFILCFSNTVLRRLFFVDYQKEYEKLYILHYSVSWLTVVELEIFFISSSVTFCFFFKKKEEVKKKSFFSHIFIFSVLLISFCC